MHGFAWSVPAGVCPALAGPGLAERPRRAWLLLAAGLLLPRRPRGSWKRAPLPDSRRAGLTLFISRNRGQLRGGWERGQGAARCRASYPGTPRTPKSIPPGRGAEREHDRRSEAQISGRKEREVQGEATGQKRRGLQAQRQGRHPSRGLGCQAECTCGGVPGGAWRRGPRGGRAGSGPPCHLAAGCRPPPGWHKP